MAKLWSEVAQDPTFQALPAEEQEVARAQYFEEVVAPQVPTSEIETVRSQFDSDTGPSIYKTAGTAAKDLAVSFGAGANSLLEMGGTVSGLVSGDMDNWARRQGESGREFYQGLKSPELRAKEQAKQEAIDKQDGEIAKFVTALKETASDPVLFSNFLAEQIPNLVGAGIGGRVIGGTAKALGAGAKTTAAAATTGAVGTGAALQGADSGGDAYDRLKDQPDALVQANDAYKKLIDDGVPEIQAREQISLELARWSAIKSAAVSAGVNLIIPGARSVERVLGGGAKAGPGGFAGAVKGGARGFVGEGIAESTDEAAGRYFANRAVKEVDPSQSLTEGVGQALAEGALFAPFGGVAGAVEGGSVAGPVAGRPTDDEAAPSVTPGATPAEDVLGRVDPETQPPFDPSAPIPPYDPSTLPKVDLPQGDLGYVEPTVAPEPPPGPMGRAASIAATTGLTAAVTPPVTAVPGTPAAAGLGQAETAVAQTAQDVPRGTVPPPATGELSPVIQPAPTTKKPSRNTVDPKADSILQAVAKAGGLSREESAAQGVDPASFKGTQGLPFGKPLFPATGGMSFDQMAELLNQHGYFRPGQEVGPNALLDAISQELSGNKVYSTGRDPAKFFEEMDDSREEEYLQQEAAEAEIRALTQYEWDAHGYNELSGREGELAEIRARAMALLGEDSVESILENASTQAEDLSESEYEGIVITQLNEAINERQAKAKKVPDDAGDGAGLRSERQGAVGGKGESSDIQGEAREQATEDVTGPPNDAATPAKAPSKEGVSASGVEIPETQSAAKGEKAATAPEHARNEGKPLDRATKYEPTAAGNPVTVEGEIDESAVPLNMSAADFKEITDEWASLMANPDERTVTDHRARKDGFISPADAKKRIDEWKAHVAEQFKNHRSENSTKTVLSLFDYTGEWSKPWREAGYNVITFDIQNGQDVMDFSVEYFTDNYDISDVYAILAACPCTDFASSGARHFAAKDADGRTEASKELVIQTLRTIEFFRPKVWALENPVGRIEDLTGLPKARMTFEPHHFGETYTKKTMLWGKFSTDLPLANVDPVEGSKMHMKYGGKSQATKNARSATPEGFSYSFFMANNYVDLPVEDRLVDEYPEASGAIKAALKAGVTEERIHALMEDTYGNYEYEKARNALAREVSVKAGESKTIDEAAHAAATSKKNDLPQPTEAQKEAGNYTKGHITLHGLDISIENPAGSRRRPEWPPLAHHYGYIKGTVGKDKDHIDVFLGKKAGNPFMPVFVVDQTNKDGKFDEHKVMLGFENEKAAREGYLANYTPGWNGLGAIKKLQLPEFKAWLEKGDTTKPVALQAKEPSDLFGAIPTKEQALADARRKVDERLSGEPVPVGEGKGDLFTGASKQLDIADAVKPAKETHVERINREQVEFAQGLGLQVGHGGTDVINEKVAQLVEALNEAGFETTMSGDLYGNDLVYVDLSKDAAGRVNADNLPTPWVLTYKWAPLTYQDVLGTPLPEKNKSQLPNVLAADTPVRIARKGGAVSGEEAAQVVAAITSKAEQPAPHFETFNDAQQWINQKSIEHGGKKKFSSTPEYKAVYDQVQALYVSQKNQSDKEAMQALDDAGLSVGDSVSTAVTGSFLTQDTLAGTITERDGRPHVKLDGGEIPVSRGGKISYQKSVAWDGRWQKVDDGKPFDSEAWDKARTQTIKESKQAGNIHLDQVPVTVETMRGREITYAHDTKEHGVIRTVDNRGSVLVYWSDKYSADKELATEKKDGKKTVFESWLAPSDLKDYVFADKAAKADKPTPSPEVTAITSAVEKMASVVDKLADKVDAIGKPAKQPAKVSDLSAALEKYEGTGELATVGDLADEVEALIDDGKAPDSLQDAVDDYRQELADDHELAGRGDMEAADENFISAVRAAIEVDNKSAEVDKEHGMVDAHEELFDRLRDGDVTADEYKSAFEALVTNEDAITDELLALTKAKLLERFPGVAPRYKNEKKSEIADAAFNDMVSDYALGESISYTYGAGSYLGSVRSMVNKATDASLAEYAARRKKATEERAAERETVLAGIENPETLEDFGRAMRVKMREMGEGTTFGEARMTFTPEQRARYDELAAEKARSERVARKQSRQDEFIRAPGETVATTEIIKTKHTKLGHDLWQFNFENRVSPEEFRTLAAQARTLGGNYSSYRGGGAIPGWQFRTEEAAKAFKALVAGDTTQAKEVAQTRRDAFADDRSQTAVERLNEMADSLEAKADASLNQDRKANTERRARFAASAEASANSDIALAKTMRNIASAIQTGKAKYLDRIRQKVQVEKLSGFVHSAQTDMLRKQYPSWADYEKHMHDKPTLEAADYVTFPSYTAFRSDLASLGRALLDSEGTKKIGQRIMKVADDVSATYLKFAKDNIDKVSTFRTKGGERAVFASRPDAETAIARSGYKGTAIVLPFKRGENIIILSPSEAVKRGIWDGDGDKRITLSSDFGAELVERIGKAARRGASITVPWQFENTYDSRKRLAGMGIETPAELRAAVREFIGLREAAEQPSKVKQLERAMIGRRNDGLDFFPTPASVVNEMIEAADIQEGMRVLEPSAGMGHIADALREAGIEPDVIELSGDRRELLEAKGYTVVGSDFLAVTDGGYDRILMNPPFSDRRDAEHVQHAYDLLKPGGRLVAIMGEGVFFGNDKKAQTLRDWLEQVGGTDEKLEAGSFLDPSLPVNTGTNARLVVITKEAGQETTLFSRPGTGPRSQAIPKAAGKAIHTFVNDSPLKAHADYKEAKAGDYEAAVRLVRDLVKPANLEAARQQFGADVVFVPAVAMEASGQNQIPRMLAEHYAAETGASTSVGEIFQTSKAYHTGAGPMERLIARPTFGGAVEAGTKYVLVDDVSTMGGTLAEMAHHIQSGGGEVAGIVTLVNAGRSATMTPGKLQIAAIERRYGDEIRQLFGIEPAALTRDEATYILGFRDADALRNRAATAERQRSERLRAKGIQEKVDSEFAQEVLSELASVDEFFRFPVSESSSLEQVMSDVFPEATYSGEDTRADERAESGADRRFVFKTKLDKTFYVFERGNEVWIDVSRLEEGGGGSAIYAAVGNYAHNAGKRFVGDPNGLSEAAIVRRTSNMLSLALRFGTTRFMEASPQQIKGFADKGIAPLAWRGDDVARTRALIDTFLSTLNNQFPRIKNARYDFQKRQFIGRDGVPIDRAAFQRIADKGVGREARAGEATLRRGIFIQSLVSSKSGQRPGILEQVLNRNRALVNQGGLQGLLSRGAAALIQPRPSAGVFVSGLSLRDAKATIARITAGYKNLPTIIPHERVDQAPSALLEQIDKAGARGDVEGAFHNGEIHLFLENLASEERLEHVLLEHEVTHYGLRGVFGKGLDPILNHIWLTNKAVRTDASRLKAQFGMKSNVEAVEETLARMRNADLAKLKGWDRLKMFIRNWLADHGFTNLADRITKSIQAKHGEQGESDLFVTDVITQAREWARSGKQPKSASLYMGVTRLSDVAPTFYSALTRAIEGSKQGTMPAAQWKLWLKANQSKLGVKQDEIDAVGVNEWLDLQKGRVSKDALLDFVRENGVQVQEVMLGGNSTDFPTSYEQLPKPVQAIVDKKDRGDLDHDEFRGQLEGAGYRAEFDEAGDLEQIFRIDAKGAPTKFGERQLPGGENYRELLLTLPEPEDQAAARLRVEAEYKRKIDEVRPRTDSRDRAVRDAAYDEIDRLIAERTNASRLAGRSAMEKKLRSSFSSSHFSEPNILAHVRFNERTDAEGKRVLFIEELQSDWAQRGRREGFSNDIEPAFRVLNEHGREEAIVTTRNAADEVIERANARFPHMRPEQVTGGWKIQEVRNQTGIPSAPFVTDTKAWTALALKRMIRYAADNGFDKVAWTTGEQQADRYDLSKQVDEILYRKNKDGTFEASAIVNDRGNPFGKSIPADKLEDYVGKDVAQRIVNGDGKEKNLGGGGTSQRDMWTSLSGLDLKVGGEGMRAFYDQMIPQVVNKYVKKWGGKVGETNLGDAVKLDEPAVGQGDFPYRIVNDETGEEVNATRTRGAAEAEVAEGEHIEVDEALIAQRTVATPAHSIDITPTMRDAVMQGQALFARPGQTQTPAFKKWFGDSKVVGAEGRPLVVYHASITWELDGRQLGDISSFDRNASTSIVGRGISQDTVGSWFSTSTDVGHVYTGDSGVVYPVYLSLQNPKQMTWQQFIDMGQQFDPKFKPTYKMGKITVKTPGGRFDADGIHNELKRQGYDGIVFPESEKVDGLEHTVYVAFEPTQIKSAVGNVGTFGPSDPDIRFSRPTKDVASASKASPLRRTRKATMEQDSSVFDHLLGGKFLFKAVGKLGQQTGAINLMHSAYDAMLQKAGEIMPESVKSAGEAVRAGIVSNYGLDEAYLDRKADMRTAEAVLARKAHGMIEMLADLTRAESRVAYYWMQEKPDAAIEQDLMAKLPEASRDTLKAMKQLISNLSDEAVSLGQLSPEARERNAMAYLHRTYAKHVLAEEGVVRRMLRSRSLRVKGDQYKGRGLFEEVEMDQIQNIAPGFWKRKTQAGKADVSLKGEKFIRFERRDASTTAMEPLPGFQAKPMGKLREVTYWPASEPVPARFGNMVDAGTWEVRGTKGGRLVMWRDLTKTERERLGELDEVRYAVAQTLQMMVHDIEVGKFFTWMATRYGNVVMERGGREVSANEGMRHAYGKDTWVRVPDSTIPGTQVKKYGALSGMYIPGPIWSDIRQIAAVRYEPLGKTYATALRFWKKSKTAWSPGVHMNNVMANFILADWHDIRSIDLYDALNVWSKKSSPLYKEIFQRFEDSGALGGMFVSHELMRDQIAVRLEEMKADINAGEDQETGNMAKVLQLVSLATAKPAKAYTKGAEAAYQGEDEFFRLAVFLKAIRYGKSDRTAGKLAREAFLDYEINAPWVQMVRHTGLPFISFFYRAFPMLLKAIRHKPWKVVKLMSFWSLLSALGYAMTGDDDEERQRKLMAEEKAGRVWGLVPKMIRMPWNSGDDPVFLDIRRWIPVGDIADLEMSHGWVPPPLIPGGPLVTLAEVMPFINKSIFTQKEIYKDTDTFVEANAKVMDHLLKSIMPNVPVPNPIGWVTGNEQGQMQTYAWSGIEKALSRKENAIGEVRTPAQALLNTIGVKIGSYPVNNMTAAALFGLKRNINSIDDDIHRINRNYSRLDKPTDADRKERDQAIAKQIAKKREQIDKTKERLGR